MISDGIQQSKHTSPQLGLSSQLLVPVGDRAFIRWKNTFMKSLKWEFKWYQPPPRFSASKVCYSHAHSHNHTLSQYTVHKHYIASQSLTHL